ncbi:DEAD/DEAH box helicase family protein [Janibacter sp. GXQ6167]|uniref:DEAD/DEAH box helicase family protein n=1 Tax=Janibacter sp. GXQ6167 TaxID=3240791 RepID=UPI003523AAD0
MTSNFDFVPAGWGETRSDAVRAETYGRTDPRSCVFYARRVVEQVVVRIFDLERLAAPYKPDLAARIGDSGFRSAVGADIAAKMDAIRKVGNVAVHENRQITPQTALNVLRQLHDVLKWAAYTYSTAPDTVPTSAAYDPASIPEPASSGAQPPLSTAELNQLLATFEAKEAALAEAKETSAALQAELEKARAEVATAQAAKAPRATAFDWDEASTRELFIDADLLEAGWALTAGRDREFPVTGMPNQSGDGFVDYVLWGDDGLPLAVIEAKRSRKDPAVGQQQAKLYADCLGSMTGRRPVIFWSNGYQHWIWDDAAGYPPRRIAGFLTRDELELMVQRRHTRLPLKDAVIDRAIVERHYQTRAIRSVGESFEAHRREALLVMATGSGKTRTVIALVDQLMKRGWVKRALFLADRVALVNQAVGAFKTHLPTVATINLVDEKVPDGRVFVSTYPTMMGLINSTDGVGGRRFGPGYFDLIVIDEAHRSVYAKYKAIFDWFDAMLVGLTATPKDEIDRNTYSLFGLEAGVPTDVYSLDEAVAEGYLVPPVSVSVPLKFMRAGIHYDQLSEAEKDEWDSLDWGEDDQVPTDVNPEELNKWLFNADTVDKALKHLMEYGHKVAGGDRLGKTIIFAKNNAHAEFIRERFDAAYPEYAGHFARVVTYKTEYAQSLIDDFSVKEKAPHIAISVDMLDTGIDVPEVVNLVFFKLVRSVSKFWQMIGRGTRLCEDLYGPGDHKANFYVFDFCMNLEYFNQPGAGSEGSVQKSLGQRLFEARLGLVAALDHADLADEVGALRDDTAKQLHKVVVGMNLDNFVVRPEREWVQRYAEWEPWTSLSAQAAGDIATHLAGLPSAVRDDDEDAKRFDLVILKIQLAKLDGDELTADRLRQQVQQITSSLLNQSAIPAIAEQQALLAEVSEDEWWVDVTLPMLELARRRIRGLVRFLEKTKRPIVYTNFEDEIGDGSIVTLPGVAVGTNWERFKAKARAYLKDHEDHVALQKLRRNKQMTDTDLSALEEMLVASGAGGAEDISRAREESQGLGVFIRSLVGLDREAATDAFSEFLTDSRFSVAEIRFIQLIVEHLTANGVLEAKRLYEPPFTDHAPTGPDFLFNDSDVDRLVVVLDQVRARAVVTQTVA